MKKRGNGPLRFWHLSGGLQSNITRLSKADANPRVQDRPDNIHHAAKRNDTLALHSQLIHDQMKEVNKNENDDSALKLAIQNNSGAAVGLLVFYGANDPEGKAKKLLRWSIRLGSFAAIKAASDINIKDSDYGRTPLHWAVWRGSRPTLELLQKRKATVNSPDNDGMTALHLACAGGHSSIVQLLIKDFGADTKAAASDGALPLHLACAGGHDSTTRLLIEKFAADMNGKTNDGATPLHLACAGSHDSTIKLLIKNYSADMKAKDRAGRTALYMLLIKLYVSQVLNFYPQLIASFTLISMV